MIKANYILVKVLKSKKVYLIIGQTNIIPTLKLPKFSGMERTYHMTHPETTMVVPALKSYLDPPPPA